MSWISNFITSHISKDYTDKVIKDAHETFEKPEISQKLVIDEAVRTTTAIVTDKCQNFETSFKTKLEESISKVSTTIEQTNSKIESTKSSFNSRIDKLDSKFNNKITELEKSIKDNATIHIIKASEKTNEVKGIVHERFDTILTMVNHDIPVFLSGPAGCGKNHLCKQVAEALGMNFYFTNAVTQEYRLTGFIDANGKYHETEFYKAATKGGLFMLDEIDGSIPEVLILLNAAIANRYFDFPNGRIELHPDFRIIAAGNTVGTGANSLYTGRTRLDAASLDRFCLVQMGYSRAIEKAITNNNADLLYFIDCIRRVSSLIVSYRAIIAITTLENSLELPEVLRMSLVKGISSAEIQSIQRNLANTGNKYINAFLTL